MQGHWPLLTPCMTVKCMTASTPSTTRVRTIYVHSHSPFSTWTSSIQYIADLHRVHDNYSDNMAFLKYLYNLYSINSSIAKCKHSILTRRMRCRLVGRPLVSPLAEDAELRRRLWAESERLVGLASEWLRPESLEAHIWPGSLGAMPEPGRSLFTESNSCYKSWNSYS